QKSSHASAEKKTRRVHQRPIGVHDTHDVAIIVDARQFSGLWWSNIDRGKRCPGQFKAMREPLRIKIDPDNLPGIVDTGAEGSGGSRKIDCRVGPALKQEALIRSRIVSRVIAHNIAIVVERERLSEHATWRIHRAEDASGQSEPMNRERAGIYVDAGHVIVVV